MVPDIALRVQTMIRAMQDVVLPAISKDDAVAREQASIILGSLVIISEQVDHLMDEMIVELRAASALLRRLIAEGKGGPVTEAALANAAGITKDAERVAALAIPSQREVKRMTADLLVKIDEIVEAGHVDGATAFNAAISEAVKDYATAQIMRWRVGNRSSGFENDPEALPGLAQLLVSDGKIRSA